MSFTVSSQSKALISQTGLDRRLNISSFRRCGIHLLYISQAMRLAGKSEMEQQSGGTRSMSCYFAHQKRPAEHYHMPGPPPRCSVQEGTHNAVTRECLSITVCSQCRGGSDGRIRLTDDALEDRPSHRIRAETSKQNKLVMIQVYIL